MENKTCMCANCFNPVSAKGYCDTHYRRILRKGSLDSARPNDWGLKEKHPLYHSWGWMKKMQKLHFVNPEWMDFWTYVQDIGERPSPSHRLYKIDPLLGYTKGNVVWKETLNSSEDTKQYAKEWRKANPDKAKNSDLKRRFGIDLEEYKMLLEKQNYSCKICGKHEDSSDYRLAVDHCHTTGKIRGLLCSPCNTALGSFKDDTDILKSAINYLENSKE